VVPAGVSPEPPLTLQLASPHATLAISVSSPRALALALAFSSPQGQRVPTALGLIRAPSLFSCALQDGKKRALRLLSSHSQTRIYVGKLTSNVTKEHVEEIFANYGKVASVDLPMVRASILVRL
jgi:hypothetical protein